MDLGSHLFINFILNCINYQKCAFSDGNNYSNIVKIYKLSKYTKVLIKFFNGNSDPGNSLLQQCKYHGFHGIR